MRPEFQPPAPRAVLLGASNLTRGFRFAVREAHRHRGRHPRIFAALGHGRSYGLKSSVLGRALPGIATCGLWTALEISTPAPTVALVTDVGNDLLYGATLDEITAWVEICLKRLSRLGALTIVTLLPEASLDRLGAVRFTLVRSLLFPRSRLRLGEAMTTARALNARLRALAHDCGAAVRELDGDWYGFDPIHIRGRFMADAWRQILEPWKLSSGAERPRGSELEAANETDVPSLRALRPEVYWRFGRQRIVAQPCVKLRSCTEISLY